MSDAVFPSSVSSSPPDVQARPPLSPRLGRGLVLGVVAAAAIGGLISADAGTVARAAAHAGEGLTRLLRAMAAIKAGMAVGLLAAILWRLGSPVTPRWLLGYAIAGAAMAAGPGLIWNMADVALGALLLHAGLIVALVMLWRDPAVARRIATTIDARRAALSAQR